MGKVITLENLAHYHKKIKEQLNKKQDVISAAAKLNADLVDDSSSNNKFVSKADKTTWNGKQDALTSASDIQLHNATVNTLTCKELVIDKTDPNIIEIGSNEEMATFAAAVNGGESYAGKIVKLTANVNLNTTVGSTSSRPFSGSFDGQGHTVTISQTLNNPDGLGGLFSFIRIPKNSIVEVKNVYIRGTMNLTNDSTGQGYLGSVISTVDAGKSGIGGTLNIKNVQSSVKINCNISNAWTGVGGFIGFIRHEDDLKPLTINIDSCAWGGILNAGPCMYDFGGFLGYTGNNKAGRTLNINITNSVSNGTFMSNIGGWSQRFGMIAGQIKGSYSDAASAKPTLNISNVICIGNATYAQPTDSGSKIGLIALTNGTTELNINDVYYYEFPRSTAAGDFPILAEGTITSSSNVVAKTLTELAKIKYDSLDSIKWVVFPNAYYPCPKSLYTAFEGPAASLVI